MKGIPAVPLTTAATADNLSRQLLAHPRHGQDSREDGIDAKTQDHHHRSQQPPQFRLRNHVAVANGGHGRPVDAARHGLELGVRPGALNHKDAVAEHHLQQEDEEQKGADGACTAPQCTHL